MSRWVGLLQRRRGLVFAVPAGALAVLVIVAALNFDQGTPPSKREGRIKDAQALLAPRVATAEELANASGSLSEQTAISLTEGAWVQVADETGRLAQQYSAARLEPQPGSRLRMTEPRARMFQRDGRVMTMSAQGGLVSVPKRALESGSLAGDVVIRLFKPVDGREVDVLRDAPSIVVHADEAEFDGVAGEVRCERAVRIETDAGSFAGEGLTLVLDASGDGIETLVVDRALEPIRIDRASRAVAAKRREQRAANAALDVRAATEDGDRAIASAAGAPSTVSRESRSDNAPAGGTRTPATTPATTPAPMPAATPARFYRLTLHGGVEVIRSRGGAVSTIRGDQLVAVFSLESEGLDQLAIVPAQQGSSFAPFSASGSTMTMSRFASPPALALATLAFAAPQSAPDSSAESDQVIVSFGGRLEMVPVVDPAEQLASKDDIRFDVLGSRVELVDGRSRTKVQCARLRYSVRDERVEADGRDGYPLRVVSSRLTLEGSRFWASFREGVGRLDGAGSMAFARGAARDVALRDMRWLELAPALAPDVARMLVSADPAAAVLVQDTPPGAIDPASIRFDPAQQELEITWKGGVDLRFAGDGDNARIAGARFEGGVDVFGRQFELGSRTLDVAFSPKDSERIEAIVADGGTRVRQLGGSGAMQAERLELYLGANSKGDSIPRKLVARSAVEAKDERQTIWTEDLVVTFAEKRVAGAPPVVNTGAQADASLGEIDVELVEAKGGVQVMLAEGARVFADELAGNALERKLKLTGDNVAIVRSNIIADNLRDLRFDDAARSARSEGPGRFRAFKKPIAVGEGRIERPDPKDQASLDASWSGQLDYVESAVKPAMASADGASAPAVPRGVAAAAGSRGSLDLRGDVRLRSRPSELVSDSVDANSVVLELGLADAKQGAVPEADAARALEHFLARGDARIESRTWTTADHAGEPKLFRLTGDHIEYDLRTREGLVVGNGGLLVNVPPGADAKAPVRTVGGATPIGFGAEGATRFTWREKMELDHLMDDRYAVRMQSQVEVLHAGARDQDRLSMRCDALEAKVRRPDETAGAKATSGVDLGGPAELLGVKGTGNVFIRTPGQDLECGEFDYSVQSGIATLKAAEGRAVTVVFANQPTPLQAAEIEWDLRAGTLEIRKPLVTGGR